MDKKERSQYLTVPEAAQELRVCDKTIRRWLVAGKLPGTRVGRKWLVPLSVLENRTWEER